MQWLQHTLTIATWEPLPTAASQPMQADFDEAPCILRAAWTILSGRVPSKLHKLAALTVVQWKKERGSCLRWRTDRCAAHESYSNGRTVSSDWPSGSMTSSTSSNAVSAHSMKTALLFRNRNYCDFRWRRALQLCFIPCSARILCPRAILVVGRLQSCPQFGV